MSQALRYLSVCSGIEAATQAWHPLGWQPVAFSEIEPFPCAVLAHHYPDVPNRGDMTRFEEWPNDAIDLLVGGTPCQDFSVAGLGKGLDGARGNLMLTYGAIARRYRPRWLAWENVPGVLSNDGGRAFGSLLGLLSGRRVEVPAGGWKSAGIIEGIQGAYGVAWRVVDAQYARTRRFPFAVPQRRRRVFVVGYLGDWRRAAAVLFDRESLSGNPPPRREAGQNVAPTLAARSKGGGGLGTDFDLDGGLIQSNSGQVGYCLTASAQNSLDAETETLLAVAHSLRGEGFDASEDGTGRGTPIVPVAPTLRAGGNTTGGHRPPGTDVDTCETLIPVQVAHTLLGKPNDSRSADLETYIPFDTTQITSAGNYSNPQPYDPCHPLAAGAHPPAIAFNCKGTQVQYCDDGSHPTLRSMGHNASHQNAGGHAAVATEWAVRRLTPVECERLQGFPDGYTSIPTYDGWRRMDETETPEECEAAGMRVKRTKTGLWVNDPDGPRYKALGNSMAVNVMEWLGARIALVDAIEVAA